MSTLGKKTVEDLNVKGRNVLVRCDLNRGCAAHHQKTD